MTRPLRILLVTNKCPPDFDGGFELRAFQIAQALRARGHEVDIVTSRYRDSFKGERNDPAWVHRLFRYVPVTQMKGPLRHFDRVAKLFESTWVAGENVPALEEFLRGHHDGSPPYDLAYCFGMLRISFAVAGPIQRRGIPILWHAGSTCIADHFFHHRKKVPGYEMGMRLGTRGWYAEEKRIEFRHVAYVSNFLRDREAERGHTAPHRYVISRGIDFPIADDVGRTRATPPVFLMAGRIDPSKGTHIALAAAALLLRARPEWPWRLEIAGQSIIPHYRAEVEAQIAREGLGGRVVFLGRLPHAEVLARMKSAHAFLFTSIYGEPFSSTIIEAMACGTPLIGSDDGSILEVVEPGVSALVYPRHDPAALAAQLERVLAEPALRHSLAEAGLATIRRRYTLDRILDLTEETMRHIAAERASLPGPVRPATP